MLKLRVRMPIKPPLGSPTCWPIRRVGIDELIPHEPVVAQKLFRRYGVEPITVAESLETADDCRVYINPDIYLRRRLVPQYRAATEMSLDIDAVRRDQIDELLIAPKLAAWILHGCEHRQI